MYKIPKPEHTAEFKELCVKRVKDGQGIGAVAKDLGLVEQTLRNWVKAEFLAYQRSRCGLAEDIARLQGSIQLDRPSGLSRRNTASADDRRRV